MITLKQKSIGGDLPRFPLPPPNPPSPRQAVKRVILTRVGPTAAPRRPCFRGEGKDHGFPWITCDDVHLLFFPIVNLRVVEGQANSVCPPASNSQLLFCTPTYAAKHVHEECRARNLNYDSIELEVMIEDKIGLGGRTSDAYNCPLWNVFSQTTPVGLKPVALPERANMALHTTTWVTSL